MENVKVLMLRMTKGLSIKEAAKLFEIDHSILHQFKDNLIKISTLSEEESINIIFDKKHTTLFPVLQKTAIMRYCLKGDAPP